VGRHVLLVYNGQRLPTGWSVLIIDQPCPFPNISALLHVLLIRKFCRYLGAFSSIIGGEFAQAVVARSTGGQRYLQPPIDRRVQLLPILRRRPAGIVGIALALVGHIFNFLDLTLPWSSGHARTGNARNNKERKERRRANHDEQEAAIEGRS